MALAPVNSGRGSGSASERSTAAGRRKRVLRGCLITTAGCALTLIALIAFLIIQLNGGLPWAFTEAPRETDKEVVAANSAGDAQRDILVSHLKAAGATAGLAWVAQTNPVLSCREGQHNWKIQNNYDLRCDTKVSVVLGSTHPSEASLRSQVLTFHDQLAALGWQPLNANVPPTSIKDIVNQSSAAGSPGSQPFLEQNSTAGYFHGERDGQGSASISLRFTADQDDYAVRGLRSPPGTITPDGEPNALRETGAFLRTGNTYVVNIEVTYVSFSS